MPPARRRPKGRGAVVRRAAGKHITGQILPRTAASVPCTVPPEALTMNQRIQFPVRIPFVEELGLELWAFGGGSAEVRVDLAGRISPVGKRYGGVLFLARCRMAVAARSQHSHDPARARRGRSR
jgi:hypothetical protein